MANLRNVYRATDEYQQNQLVDNDTVKWCSVLREAIKCRLYVDGNKKTELYKEQKLVTLSLS